MLRCFRLIYSATDFTKMWCKKRHQMAQQLGQTKNFPKWLGWQTWIVFFHFWTKLNPLPNEIMCTSHTHLQFSAKSSVIFVDFKTTKDKHIDLCMIRKKKTTLVCECSLQRTSLQQQNTPEVFAVGDCQKCSVWKTVSSYPVTRQLTPKRKSTCNELME